MKYKITIYDEFFKKEFISEWDAGNEKEAINKCKEFYAQELDTTIEDIQVKEVIEV